MRLSTCNLVIKSSSLQHDQLRFILILNWFRCKEKQFNSLEPGISCFGVENIISEWFSICIHIYLHVIYQIKLEKYHDTYMQFKSTYYRIYCLPTERILAMSIHLCVCPFISPSHLWCFHTFPDKLLLTHWGRAMHICVSKPTIIGSDNGLSPGRRQVIIWTNAGRFLIRTSGTNVSEFFSKIHTFSFKKMHRKISSVKWQPFCSSLNVLTSDGCIHYDNETLQAWSALGHALLYSCQFLVLDCLSSFHEFLYKLLMGWSSDIFYILMSWVN